MVSSGLDVARRLESFATGDPDGKPSRPLYMFSITVSSS